MIFLPFAFATNVINKWYEGHVTKWQTKAKFPLYITLLQPMHHYGGLPFTNYLHHAILPWSCWSSFDNTLLLKKISQHYWEVIR
jgi:hypothetical protein